LLVGLEVQYRVACECSDWTSSGVAAWKTNNRWRRQIRKAGASHISPQLNRLNTKCSYPPSACTLPLLRVLACRVSLLSLLSVWSVTDCMATSRTSCSSDRPFLLSAFVCAVSLAAMSTYLDIGLTRLLALIPCSICQHPQVWLTRWIWQQTRAT
jgi:hypothetical protein